ncbi:MAG TPA: PLP-dependent aminotransferase family protein [Longimicrobiaceae bacterium]|nr:PLP-dependent aminotransferase family protein [Longimicrobiaceae bacterium]
MSAELLMDGHAAPTAPDAGDPREALAGWARAVRPSTIQEMLGLMARPGMISFALGLPAPELFPREEYARAAARLLAGDDGPLQYRPPHALLREQVAELMRARGVRCAPEQVFLTTGAQQGLALLARLFLEPRGTVICEQLVYMGFQQVIEPFQPRVLPVDTDLETGLDVDAVERHLAGGARPAFIYCITDGHNPLGVSVSPEKRERLVALAARYRVPILEDDAYGLLHYGPPHPPLRALDDRWVFYVGSFSKVMAPGFRVGWVVAPEAFVPVLGCAKDGADIDTSTFSQRLVSAYLESGHFPQHLARVREAYRERRDLMLDCLARWFPAGTRWSVPRHGALVWVELPPGYDAGELLRAALEREGVAFVPGRAFAVDGGDAGTRCLRLNFSFPPPDVIEEGMRRLARVLSESPA